MQKSRIWLPLFVLYWREIRRFGKVLAQTVLTPFLNSTLYLLIFGVSLGGKLDVHAEFSYLAFLIPGLVTMSILMNSFQNSSSSLVAGKFSGDLEDLKIVPLRLWQIVLALNLGALTRGLLVGAITFLVGEVFHYFMEGSLIAVAHPVWLLFFSIMGGISFASLGITVAIAAKTFDQLSAVANLILQPLIYLGGVFIPLTTLHPIWRRLSEWNPLLYIVNGIRFSVLGESEVNLAIAVVVSVVGAIMFQVLAVQALKVGSFDRW